MISDVIIGQLCRSSHELDELISDIHHGRPSARTLGAVEERVQAIADQMRAAVRGMAHVRPLVNGTIHADRIAAGILTGRLTGDVASQED